VICASQNEIRASARAGVMDRQADINVPEYTQEGSQTQKDDECHFGFVYHSFNDVYLEQCQQHVDRDRGVGRLL
jgi:hypothetical protein